jgi:hypothetical protein
MHNHPALSFEGKLSSVDTGSLNNKRTNRLWFQHAVPVDSSVSKLNGYKQVDEGSISGRGTTS